MPQDNERFLVGGEEWGSLPELGIPWVKARVDSGARTSSLHAWHIRRFRRAGVDWVAFRVHPLQRDRRTVVDCEARLVDHRGVRSSSGATESRYVIRTLLELSGESFPIELTLTSRDSMGYRMLLGREAMQERLIVDPSHSFLCRAPSLRDIEETYARHRIPAPHLVVGVLTDGDGDDDVFLACLRELAAKRGHQLQCIDANTCELEFENHHERLRCDRVDATVHVDVMLSMLPVERSEVACALLRHFEYLGAHCPNSARAFHETAYRSTVLQRLVRSGTPVPDTRWSTGIPGDGPGTDARVVIRRDGAQTGAVPGFLVQDLPSSPTAGLLRCYVAVPQVIAVPLKTDSRGRLKPGKGRAAKPDRDARRVIRSAMRALGVGVASVDILCDGDDLMVLDVDAFALAGVPAVIARRYADVVIRQFERAVGGSVQPAP
ncbi:MAG: hypothetical protein DWQ08_04435 [Proteobacteria bacterium]|nr:MAG: hypothetical protein DWQ08_04435 [Pseudomonadota bacterium]